MAASHHLVEAFALLVVGTFATLLVDPVDARQEGEVNGPTRISALSQVGVGGHALRMGAGTSPMGAPMSSRENDKSRESGGAQVVTLVMDGGTGYVLIQLLGMTIDSLRQGQHIPGAAEDVLIHAHDELAGQLEMHTYSERTGPFA